MFITPINTSSTTYNSQTMTTAQNGPINSTTKDFLTNVHQQFLQHLSRAQEPHGEQEQTNNMNNDSGDKNNDNNNTYYNLNYNKYHHIVFQQQIQPFLLTNTQGVGGVELTPEDKLTEKDTDMACTQDYADLCDYIYHHNIHYHTRQVQDAILIRSSTNGTTLLSLLAQSQQQHFLTRQLEHRKQHEQRFQQQQQQQRQQQQCR